MSIAHTGIQCEEASRFVEMKTSSTDVQSSARYSYDQRAELRSPKALGAPPKALLWPAALMGISLGQVTVICAEPGMGKTYLTNRIIQNVEDMGWESYRYCYEHISSEVCCRRMVRISREIVLRQQAKRESEVGCDQNTSVKACRTGQQGKGAGVSCREIVRRQQTEIEPKNRREQNASDEAYKTGPQGKDVGVSCRESVLRHQPHSEMETRRDQNGSGRTYRDEQQDKAADESYCTGGQDEKKAELLDAEFSHQAGRHPEPSYLGGATLVVFEDVVPGDELEVWKEANAIARLRACGCFVLITLVPEAEQLLDALGERTVLRTEELLFRSEGAAQDEWRDTGGIPALVAARELDYVLDMHEEGSPEYIAALGRQVDATMREGLPHEELRIRLAALLLGHGTMEELAMVSGRCDMEMLSLLHRDVTLLGIDLRTRSFCCHGVDDNARFRACMGTLQASAASFPQVVVQACGVLATRGDAKRSALVSTLCSSENDYLSVCVAWGVSYVLAGEGMLVDEALRVMDRQGASAGGPRLLAEAASRSMSATIAQLDHVRHELEEYSPTTVWEQRLHQNANVLLCCRDAWRCPREAMPRTGISPDNAIGHACLEHLRVFRLLANGSFEEAYATLTNRSLSGMAQGLPTALLCDDLYLGLMLAGGVPDRHEQKMLEQAGRFFAGMGVSRLQAYHTALSTMPSVLMGLGTESMALEEAVAAADRAGDSFVQAVFLLTLAVRDVRVQALSRAHVRSASAAEIARALGEAYLTSAAEFVDALALELLDDAGAMMRYNNRPQRPASFVLLGRMITQSFGQAQEIDVDLYLSLATPCPRDVLWALNLVIFDCGRLSQGLAGKVPGTWVELLRTIRTRQEGQLQETLHDAAATGEGAGVRERSLSTWEGGQTEMLARESVDPQIRVSVFGGFSVRMRGETFSGNYFERRRARDLIALLAVASGHRMRRYQAVEALWPDSDYYRGPRKLYEATGEARKRLGGTTNGYNPLVSDRAQGTVGFDPALVGCDVDDFEREARLALAEDGDDFWVLEHAREMERVYGTGPDEHIAGLSERVAERLEEFETLYVDVAVAAAEAALRLGKVKLAVRFGTDAHRMRELREDAILVLVQALRAAGRGFEILPLYRRYAKRLMEVEGVPPSLTLRRAVIQATGEGPDLSSV